MDINDDDFDDPVGFDDLRASVRRFGIQIDRFGRLLQLILRAALLALAVAAIRLAVEAG
jgi:hypothetical protein